MVQEYVGNPWGFSENIYTKQQTQHKENNRRLVGAIGNWFFGSNTSNSSSSNSNFSKNWATHRACEDHCKAEKENLDAICSGYNDKNGGLLFSKSDKEHCEAKARDAEHSCKNSCYQ